GPGDSFGEACFLDEYPHSTSATVSEATVVLELPRAACSRIAVERPELHSRLVVGAAQIMASRLRAANASLADRADTYLSGELRREKDLLGSRELPDHLYYGIQTLRAVENFPITGISISKYPHLISA